MINNELISKFNTTKIIGDTLYVDEINKLWTIPEGIFSKKINPKKIYSYNDILKCELIEENGTNNLGIYIKEVCLKLQIKILLKNISNSPLYINLISLKTKKSSLIYKIKYKQAQDIISSLEIMCSEKNQTANEFDLIEQIEKYKKLLDSGAITEEEYNKKKSELLNL